jgi:hypothetical protein
MRIGLFISAALMLAAVHAAGQAPEITHIGPVSAINAGPVLVHIYGDELQGPPVTAAALEKAGYPGVTATAIDVTSDGHMTCSLDVTGALTGLYDVILDNGQGTDTLPSAFTVYAASPAPFVWDRMVVGSALTMLGVTVGDGNDDGEIEVYGACTDANIYQFKWNGATWEKTVLGAGTQYMYRAAVGDGNSDGQMEVYGSNADGRIYQFKWNGSSWDRRIVGAGADYMYGVCVGDGNMDGEMEVYGANLDGSVYQFKWDGAAWQTEVVGTGGSLMYAVAVEDGDNDEELDVYGGNADANIYQHKWTGTEWEQTVVGSGMLDMRGVASGDGNGDGQNEVYGASWDYNIYQFKWNGVNWVQTTVGTGSAMMYGVAIGNGNGDSEVEVYAANQDDKVYEFWWDGGGWQDFTVGTGQIMMYGVAVGDGNNDGQMEVYGADWDGSIYQFKPLEVGVQEERLSRGSFFLSPRVNPVKKRVLFDIATPGESTLEIRIYDMTGRLIDIPFGGTVSAGRREVAWEADVPSGVYFYEALSRWGARTGKLVLIK